MEDFLKFLVSPLLSAPDQLRIVPATGSLTLHVDPADMGRIIGKHGIIISALRNLLRTYCSTHSLPLTTLTIAEKDSP